MEAIKYYVKGAFVGVAETPEVLEQQEELIADLTAKVADLVASGRSQEEALGTAIASMGDLSSLVREFATDEPEPATPAEKPVRRVEVYASRLQLHTVVMSAGGSIAVLFVLSLLAASGDAIGPTAAVWDLLLGGLAVAWIGYALRGFHQEPDAIATVELGEGKRLKTALLQWAGVCAFAFVFNVIGAGVSFWAWTIWIASAAWPASMVVEQRLVEAGMFLHPKADATTTSCAVDMAPAGASASGTA